jgi:hypothetical protein
LVALALVAQGDDERAQQREVAIAGGTSDERENSPVGELADRGQTESVRRVSETSPGDADR